MPSDKDSIRSTLYLSSNLGPAPKPSHAVEVRNASIPPPPPLRPPSAQDWETYRPLITRLYVVERKRLKDVISILEQGHGFHASGSDRMFKKRIDEWKIHKNYKRTDKMLALDRLKNISLRKLVSEYSNDPRKIHRLTRFCKENGLKDEALILEAVKVQRSSQKAWKRANEAWRCAKKPLGQEDKTNCAYLALHPCPVAPLTSSGQMRDVEIILFEIGHYFQYHFSSQLGAACSPRESRKSAIFDAKDVFRLLFYSRPPERCTDFWTSIDHSEHLLHHGEARRSAVVLNTACDVARELFTEEETMLIPCLISLFTDRRHYWSNEVPSQVHDFLAKMAAIVLGSSHPITVIINRLKNIQRFEISPLFWQRVLDISADQLRICNRTTLEIAKSYSHALYFPSYAESTAAEDKSTPGFVGIYNSWSQEEVFAALKYHFENFRYVQWLTSGEGGSQYYWLIPRIHETLDLLQTILISDASTVNARQQWLRRAVLLQVLLLCEDIYDHTSIAGEETRYYGVPARPSGNIYGPMMSRSWMHLFFSTMPLLQHKFDLREEAPRLKTMSPGPF